MAESLEKPKRHADRKPRRMHPNSLKNLHPRWKPGEAGNPRGESMVKRLARLMEQPLSKPPADSPAYELFLHSMLVAGIEGSPAQFREIWERLEGKVPQPATLTGADGGPVEFTLNIGIVKEKETDGS